MTLDQDTLLHAYLLLFTQGYKWQHVRVHVDFDIVYEKAYGALQLPRLYTPRGAENDKRDVICPMKE